MTDINSIQNLITNNSNSTQADSGSIINVNQTSYDVENDWMKIAAKYFNIDLDAIQTDTAIGDSEISLLKAGLFGYLNEISAHEVKNAVYDRNVKYDEYFLNSASFPESIYNFAKLYNVDVSMSTPSHMVVTLIVKKSDLINSPLKKEIVNEQYVDRSTLKTFQIILDRTYQFNVEKYSFLLPYDVQVLMKQSQNGDYTISAKYLIDDTITSFDTGLSPDAKLYQDTINGESYIYINLDVYQLQSNVNEFNITSADISDNLYYTVPYSDQIAGFNVTYTYMGQKYPVNAYFNNTFTPSDSNEKFCYYTFLDDDKLEISFSSLPNSFRPAYNSILTVESLTTKGSEGNFNYTGEINFNYTATATNSFATMLTSIKALTAASGGKDRLTIEEEKQKIITKNLTRDNIITDGDLETFFNNINATNTVNGSSIKFMRKRDDVLMRVYNAFLLLRNKDGKVLPTDTAPYVRFDRQWFKDNLFGNDTDGYIVPEHTIFKCTPSDIQQPITDTNKDVFSYIPDGYNKFVAGQVKGDKDNLYYVNPFLIKIDVDPIVKATYYKMDISASTSTSYTYLNNLIPTNIIINQLDVNKSISVSEDASTADLDSDTYKITFNLNSNEAINAVDAKIRVRGVLMSAKTKKKYGYFEFNRESSDGNNQYSTYTAYLSTNRKFQDDKLCLSNSLFDLNGTPIDEIPIDEEVFFKIGILYDNTSGQYNNAASNDNSEINLFMDPFPKNETTNIKDFVVATVVTGIDSIYLYRNLSDMMNSVAIKDTIGTTTNTNGQISYNYVAYADSIDGTKGLMFNQNGTKNFVGEYNSMNTVQSTNPSDYTWYSIKDYSANQAFKVEMIPMINLEYFMYNYDSVYDIIERYIQIINELLPNLENSTTVDMKFYNTRGTSRYFYLNILGDDNNAKTIKLGRTDVLFDFKIYLYDTPTNELDSQIKQYISDFVEACNAEGLIPISNLIRSLEENFAEIKFIIWNGISNSYTSAVTNSYQKIINTGTDVSTLSKQEVIEYVPEYINVKKRLVDNLVEVTNNDGTTSTINLGKKYDFVINVNYASNSI